MENQNNIKDLETLLNEAKMEQEIKSILEELGTNDAPEAVKAGEPDEIEGTATKEDVLPEEVKGEDVKEVVVESEETKSKEVFDLEKDFPKDAKTTDDVEEVAGEAEKEDALPEEVKGEDVKEVVVESEGLESNDAPEAVKEGEPEEVAGEAKHDEVFPAEECAEDVKEAIVEDSVTEDTLEQNPETTSAEAEGNEDRVADVDNVDEINVVDPINPELEVTDEIEDETKEDTSDDAIQESLNNIFSILREELGTNDAPEAAKEGEPEEVAGEAKKEDVLPEEVEGEDVKEVVVESEELKANESPEVVKLGNAEEASGEAEHEEVFPAEESAEDVKEVVVESEEISDLELMELLDESEEYEPSIKNVMLLREDKELLNEFLGLGGKAAAKRQLKIEQMKSENDPKKAKKLEKLEKRQGRFMRRAAAQSSSKGMKAFAKESEIQKDNAEKLKKAQANIQKASTTLNSSYEIKEEYTTLEEAFELGKAHFADDVDKARLVEQVALSIAKENNDRIFVEMVNATVLAARLQEQLLEKYSDVSEARINMIFEEMEANDAPEVVKEGEPEEVAGEAEKEDVLPEEVKGEDVKEAEVE